MKDQHLSLELLRAIHRQERSPGDLVPVAMAHLFELCSHCREAFEAWRRELGEGVADPSFVQYDAAFDRVRACVRRRAADPAEPEPLDLAGGSSPEERVRIEETEARERTSELLALSPRVRADRIRRYPERYSGPVLANLLIAEARGHLPGRPQEAHAVAGLARAVLQHSTSSVYAGELYARALAHQANALRAQGELRRAEELFDVARYLLKSQGGGDRLTQAELDSFEGSLRGAQRRFEEAEVLLSRAALAYAMDQQPLEAARSLTSLGMIYREAGDLLRAVEVTEQAEDVCGDRNSLRLLLMVRHNLAAFHHELGDQERARSILEESSQLYDQFSDPWTQLRRIWLQGHLARAEGDVEGAELSYELVRDGFLEQGIGLDAALAALDLAVLYAQQQRFGDVKRVAEEIVPVFEAQDVHREAATALMLFQDAVRTEQVTLRYLVELYRYLERARLDPSLVFQTPT